MSKPRSSTLAILVPLSLALLAGCSDSGSPETAPPTATNPAKLEIGMVVSLSGPARPLGEETKRGVEVAVAQINALGGILNKQVEVIVENDSSDPAITLQKVNDLIARGITLGIGPSTSTSALQLKELLAQDKVVYISPSATSRVLDKLTEVDPPAPAPGQPPANPVFFRTAATDVFLSAALTQYASTSEAAGARRCPDIVLVQQDDSYGAPIGDAVEKYYKLFSLVVRKRLLLDPKIDNLQKLGDAASSVGDTQAKCQVVVAQPEVAGAYMRAFKTYTEQNPAKKDWSTFLTIGSDGFRQNEFIAAGRVDRADQSQPTAGEGSVAIAADTAPPEQEYSFFLNLFKARFPNDEPGRYGSTAYDAMIMLAASIERAGGVEDHKKVRDTLYKLSQGRTRVGPNKLSDMFDLLRRGEDINYEGASGSLDFTAQGHVRSAFGVWKITNAQFVKVKEFKISELSDISNNL